MDLGDVLSVGFGWLLGLLSPAIADAIKTRKERKEVQHGLLTEMAELKPRLAGLVYELSRREGLLNHELIDRLLPIMENDLSDKSKDIAKNLKKLRAITKDEMAALKQRIASEPLMDVGLKTFQMPFLDSKVGYISAFSIDFQYRLHQIRTKVDLINQQVEQVKFFYELSFNPNAVEHSGPEIGKNLEASYSGCRRIAEDLLSRIGEIQSSEKH